MQKFNDWLAVRATLVFGTMWMTYLFFFYGFIPIMFPNQMNTLLYWSNSVQLWSLPLLMVGQNVMGRVSEKRSQETHDAVMEELAGLRRLYQTQSEEFAELKAMHEEVHIMTVQIREGVDGQSHKIAQSLADAMRKKVYR